MNKPIVQFPTLAERSPTINEKLIERHLKPDDDDPILREMVAAAKLARENADKAKALTAAVMKNTLKTEAARHKEARTAGWKLTEKATLALDAARKAAVDKIEVIKNRTKGPTVTRDLVTETRMRELRERLSLLPKERRDAILHEAVANDDELLVAAVLSVQSWLSGMSDAEVGMVRHAWVQKHFAADVDRMQRLGRAIEDVDRIGTIVNGYVDKLTDLNLVAEAERAERAAAEALKSLD